MPTEHKKKKLTKKPKTKQQTPTIKTEPQELHSLAHYVHDPVELIRQIFDALDSKLIKKSAPDFLQVSFVKVRLGNEILFECFV